MLSKVEFGNFTDICTKANLPICNLWSPILQRTCTGGKLAVGGTQLASFGDLLISGISVILMLLIIYRTHVKYAAVGRKEMNILFSFFLIGSILKVIASTGLVTSTPGTIIAALQVGFVVGFFWVLLMNGLVGFQLVEDGAALSFFGILASGLVWVAVGTIFSLDISQSLLHAGTSTGYYKSTTMFGLYFLFPLVTALGYLILQTVLVAKNLGDQKPLISLYAAAVFFIASQVLTFGVSMEVCRASKILEGTVIATFFDLASLVFIYRFWDSITEDDWDNIDDIFI
eukprot:Partr_v1_DN24501_c0_g1_i1_m19680 putative Export control protein